MRYAYINRVKGGYPLNKLADNLKSSRNKAGLTQEQVANKLGLSIGTISGYERGYRRPDPDILKKLADLYNVATDFLLGREPKEQMALKEARFPYLADDLPNMDLDKYLMDIREAVGKAVAAGDIELERAENLVQETTRYLMFQIEQLKKNGK
jgi:transcriptional regulator with XRE-family HTH domain